VAVPMSGQGVQEGLMNGPKAITVAADGRLLVLEQGNSRVQAFDVTGSPVQCFAGVLEFELDGGYAATLDQRVITPALALELHSKTRPTLAPRAFFDDDVIGDLDASRFTSGMQRKLSAKGITLAAAAALQTVAAGSIWLLKDPENQLDFDLRFDGVEVAARSAATWSVEVQSKGLRWSLRDDTNVQTFRLLKDTIGGKLKGRQLIAPMTLKDPQTNLEYLDIACEPEGFIYVLSYLRPGDEASKYHLDIYNPDGTHLARTPKTAGATGVAAAKITVDHWRTMFTLNYEKLLGPGGRT
jgi:hypothetical protein